MASLHPFPWRRTSAQNQETQVEMPSLATPFTTLAPATLILHFTDTVPAGAEITFTGTKAEIFNPSKPG